MTAEAVAPVVEQVQPQQAPEIVLKKASAELVGEVLHGQATRGEAGGLINYLDKAGPGTIDTMAGRKAPDLTTTALKGIFGDKIPPPRDALRPLYQVLSDKLGFYDRYLNPNIEIRNATPVSERNIHGFVP